MRLIDSHLNLTPSKSALQWENLSKLKDLLDPYPIKISRLRNKATGPSCLICLKSKEVYILSHKGEEISLNENSN